jgi:hypothetical protein
VNAVFRLPISLVHGAAGTGKPMHRVGVVNISCIDAHPAFSRSLLIPEPLQS